MSLNSPVIIILDSTIQNSSIHPNCYNLLRNRMNITREESLVNLIEFWQYLRIIHHSPLMKTKRALALYYSIPWELRKQFLLEYIVKDYNILRGQPFESDEDFMIQVLRKKKGETYMQLDLWKRKSFVSRAVQYSRDALKFALCVDSGIISSSLEFQPKSLQHCKREVRNDKEMVMKALGKYYGVIMFVGESLLDNVEILRKCLSRSKTLKNLKFSMTAIELMKEIVKRYSLSILRFYKWLKDEVDFEVRSTYLLINGKSFSYPNNILGHIEDVEVARKFIEFSGKYYNEFCEIIREDVELFKLAIRNDSCSIFNIPNKIAQMRDVIHWIYENGFHNSRTDQIVCEHFQNDDEMTNYLLKIHVFQRNNFPHCLNKHRDFCRKAIRMSPSLLFSFDRIVVDKLILDEDFLFEIVQENPSFAEHLHRLSNDFFIRCLKANPNVFSYIGSANLTFMLSSWKHVQSLLEIDPNFIERAVKRVNWLNDSAMEYVLSVDPNLLLIFPTLKITYSTLKHCTKMAIENGLDTESQHFKSLDISRDQDIVDFIKNRGHE